MEPMGKYRTRTWLRMHLPGVLSDLFPKGRSNCGDHEWYRVDEGTWRCAHCVVGETHEVPWPPDQAALINITAMGTIAGAAMRRPLDEYELQWLQRLAAELPPLIEVATADHDVPWTGSSREIQVSLPDQR